MQTKTSETKSLVDGYGPAVGDTTGYNTVSDKARRACAVPYVRQVKAEEGLACLFPWAFQSRQQCGSREKRVVIKARRLTTSGMEKSPWETRKYLEMDEEGSIRGIKDGLEGEGGRRGRKVKGPEAPGLGDKKGCTGQGRSSRSLPPCTHYLYLAAVVHWSAGWAVWQVLNLFLLSTVLFGVGWNWPGCVD